ncbi:MAG: FKBP-type peptidyl-prolyl cis-trans isomerase [Vicinamibacterales bacterium]|nr:FKBP-type peptidyl-prolyl cis-trans isomerase [Vicinamibacterales bacterium]
MPPAKPGDTVRVHYRGTLADGSVFASSEGADPLEFTLGKGQVIAGLEDAVVGMRDGDIRTVNIPPQVARNEELVKVMARTDLPPDLDLEIGDELEADQTDGSPLPVRVTALTETTVTVDGNDLLAGETLTLRIELLRILKPSAARA